MLSPMEKPPPEGDGYRLLQFGTERAGCDPGYFVWMKATATYRVKTLVGLRHFQRAVALLLSAPPF